MGVSIANLNVMLTANASQFSATMKASRKDIDQVNAAVERGQRSMKAFYETQNRATSRGFVEQKTRDEMAARIKAMRAATLNDKVAAEVNQRLFGGTPAVAKAAEDAGKIASKHFTAAIAPSSKGFLDNMKGMFGEESKWGKVFKLFAGTGAVAGLSMAANQFNELTIKAEAFALALHRADGSASELAADLLTSIPIVGKLGEGLARVWSIMSGEAAAIEDLKRSTANTNAVTDAMASRMKIVAQFAKESADRMEEMDRHIARIVLNGQSLKLFDIDSAAIDRLKQLNADTDKAKGNESLEASRTKLADLRKQQINTPTMIQGWGFDSLNGEAYKTEMIANPAYTQIAAEIAAIEKQIAATEAGINENAAKQTAKSEGMRWAEKMRLTLHWGTAWVAENADAANKVANGWIDAVKEASKARTNFIADLQRSWDQLDWTESERKLDDFKRKFAPSPEELERAKELFDALDMAAEQKKFLDSLDSEDKVQSRTDGTKERLATIERRYTANVPREAFQREQKMLKAAEKTAKATQDMNVKMGTVVNNLDFEVLKI